MDKLQEIKQQLQQAEQNFNYADQNYIDAAIYEINAVYEKFSAMLREEKRERGAINEIRIRN